MGHRDGPLGTAGQDRIPEREIRAELQRILASEIFARSDRLSHFLSFTVERTLAGNGDALKEYVLGVEVLGRGESFDPRTDTIVRVHARRLRGALTEYYAGAGKDDRVAIEFPAGGYAASFHRREEEVASGSTRRRLIAAVSGAGLAAAGLIGWWWGRRRPLAARDVDSIAVLPFVDLGTDKAPEYFCDGLTEEIINALSRIEDVRVVARTSVFQFKGKTADIREIGRQLRVTAVLEGSVRKAGDRVRITLQLIKVADGYHLWSENYDREFGDVLDLQSQIARDVANPLQRRLRGRPNTARVPEAHALYLQGLFYWNKWTVHDFFTSIQYYERAIAKDPTYALAFAGLADSYGTLGHLGAIPAKEAYAKKEQVLSRALQLDPDLPEARTSLAMTRAHEWNWPAAEQELRRALALQPQSVTAHRHYAVVLHLLGRFEEARKEIEKAYVLDPLSAEIRATAGHIAQRAREYRRALEWYTKALEIDPNHNRALLGLGEVYLELGDRGRAMEFLEKARRLAPDDAETMGILGYALGRTGRRREAMALAENLKQLSERRPVPAAYLADVYIGMGDKDRALGLLEQAYEAHEGRVVQLKVNPRYDPLRADRRFVNLLKKLGFTL